MTVRKRTLRSLAGLVWYAGGLILLLKGSQYVLHAAASMPGSVTPWLGGATGVVIGALRGRRAFARGCRKNLARIDALERPKAWQFFRPRFFLALAAMIAGGVLLRLVADAGGVWAALGVGSLELVIAVALLTSSLEFWRWRGPRTDAGDAGRRPPHVGPAAGEAARDVA